MSNLELITEQALKLADLEGDAREAEDAARPKKLPQATPFKWVDPATLPTRYDSATPLRRAMMLWAELVATQVTRAELDRVRERVSDHTHGHGEGWFVRLFEGRELMSGSPYGA